MTNDRRERRAKVVKTFPDIFQNVCKWLDRTNFGEKHRLRSCNLTFHNNKSSIPNARIDCALAPSIDASQQYAPIATNTISWFFANSAHIIFDFSSAT